MPATDWIISASHSAYGGAPDRFARDRVLRDRIEELRGRLDGAGDDDRAALAAELDAARGARDALWDDPAEEAADIAALRTGKPAAYDEIRALLSP